MEFQVGDIVAVPMMVNSIGYKTLNLVCRCGFTGEFAAALATDTDHGPITLIRRPEQPAYFADAKVGDEVWSMMFGNGRIDRVGPYGIDVDNGISGQYSGVNIDGVYILHGKNQSFFYASDPRVAELKKILGVRDE